MEPTKAQVKSALLQIMCNEGELINRGDDFYEDMGGHCSHESNLDGCIEEYVARLTEEERNELAKWLGVPE